ncbi:hypothetical protein [Agrococcus beijingensis]|uniref:hypothetical protein n=1 Tax=Agrococcus beijingensis TaxID=3068634 RepID=UPI0027407B40|nr:hypothetical protein [Agrococcus sp. REN33]
MIPITTQFEFRLVDGAAPSGELEADQLIAIAQSLKELATKLSRSETEAEPIGRPSARTQRVARLTIGLAPGSTRVLVRRSEDDDALAFDLDEERAFDEKFEAIVDSIALDERPDWVTDTVALAAGELRSALEKAAPKVEFLVAGRVSAKFSTAATHRETWRPRSTDQAPDTVTFVGQLRMVNLDTQRLQVTDDVGNKVALPNVVNADHVGGLIGSYVAVVGVPGLDARGRLAQIQEAVIEPAVGLAATAGARAPASLESILASAPGPEPGGLPGLAPQEAEAFLQAIGR